MIKLNRNLVHNTLLESCIKHDMNMDDFNFLEGEDKYEFTIIYKESKWRYKVRKDEENKAVYGTQHSPAFADSLISIDIYAIHNLEGFSAALRQIDNWIKALAYEENEPDLWQERLEAQTNNVLDLTDNESLTEEEQVKAVQILEDIKAYILEYGNQSEELKAHLDTRFDYVESTVTRLGKKDFIVIVMGAVLSVVISQMLSPEDITPFISFAMEQIQLLSDIDIPQLTN